MNEELCPVCQCKNKANLSFCSNCRYPLGVKRLDEVNTKELIVHLESLQKVMQAQKPSCFDDKELERLYDEFFHLDWLRPESAIIRFVRARIMTKLRDRYLPYPMLDLGCGDGVYTSILFGAQLNRDYDAYEDVDFTQSDIYNSFRAKAADRVVQRSDPIGCGVDIKESMVNRANALGCYDEVVVGDIRNVPYPKENFSSVYCSMVDDIDTKDLFGLFGEVNRLLDVGGFFMFTTPTEHFREFLHYINAAETESDEDLASIYRSLDRGRSEWESRPRDTWEPLLASTGFEMVEYIEYGSREMMQFWDTGFRVAFKYLMTFRSLLVADQMNGVVKNLIVDMLKNYLKRFTDEVEQGAFAIIVAKKGLQK